MDVRGLKVAIIGDSHTQTALGKGLVSLLKKEGASVTNLGIGGTSAEQWLKPVTCFPGKDKDGCKADAKRVRLDDEAKGAFDLVIVSLGTNDGANASAAKNPGGVLAPQFPDQLFAIARRVAPRLFYVGPPAMRGSQKHYTDANIQPYFAAVKAAIGDAAIDSYTPTKSYVATEGDGVHLFDAKSGGGKAWVDTVFDAIKTRMPYELAGGRAIVATSSGAEGGPKWLLPVVAVGVVAGIVAYFRRKKA